LLAALHTEVVEYRHGKTLLEGYIAYDDGVVGRRPGALVVHEWMGHGPYARRRAEQLAGLGYADFPVRGVVSFHGGLGTPTPATAKSDTTRKIRPKILVLLGADWQMVPYGGAVHSFTVSEAVSDPNKGMAYNESTDRRSWQAMVNFLAEVFQ
jgi:dienelactone hydrolase